MLSRVRVAARAGGAPRFLCAVGPDLTPMSISDRVEAAALRSGAFASLKGKGKPLPEGDSETQAHIAQLPKNLEGRAEAECRRASRDGLLSKLGGEGKPLPDNHRESSMSQASIQQHAQRTVRKG